MAPKKRFEFIFSRRIIQLKKNCRFHFNFWCLMKQKKNYTKTLIRKKISMEIRFEFKCESDF
jgi:hypothetical protein